MGIAERDEPWNEFLIRNTKIEMLKAFVIIYQKKRYFCYE